MRGGEGEVWRCGVVEGDDDDDDCGGADDDDADDDDNDDDSPAAHCIFCSSALHRVKAAIFSWGYTCYT